MILISPTRTLPSPRPIDTDPILNYRHIQPAAAAAAAATTTTAAAAAAVGPWLGQNQHQDHHPHHQHQHQHHHQHHQHHSLPTSSNINSPSELSASPAPSVLSSGSCLLEPQSVPRISIPHFNSPPPIMLPPQPSSDDETSTAEEEKPSLKPNLSHHTPTTNNNNINNSNNNNNSNNHTTSTTTTNNNNNNNNNNTNPPNHQPPSVSLYDLPTSSSAPATSSSSSPFPSTLPSHQHASYASSPHPNRQEQQTTHPHHAHHTHHDNQFYQPSPPPLHSPLHPVHHPQQPFDQRPHSSFFAPTQHYHSRPQSAPHSTSQFSLDPEVLAAAAAHVEVKKWDEENTYYYQVAHKGVTVGRLKGSGLVNGTKLLNLAGISRGKRDGILKNEKIRKVVKHGTMHLKGVWIAFDRAVFLAEQHNIAQKIFPLLVVNLEHYVPIEPSIMAGGTKIGPSSLFHHHHPRHPRLLPQPIKFSPSVISLAPATANSFSSNGGWPSGPSSALPSIAFSEPFSAPPLPRSAATSTSPSVYEQAQYQYLNSPQTNNPDLLERRHTIPNNHFHAYNSVPSFGSSSQAQVSYPFHYHSTQITGYPPRSAPSESSNHPHQFEYQQQSKAHHVNSNGTDPTGSYSTSPLYHSQSAAPRPGSSTTTTQPSPALNSAPLGLADISPGSSSQILDHPVTGDFRLPTRSSNAQIKQETEDESSQEKRLVMEWNPSC